MLEKNIIEKSIEELQDIAISLGLPKYNDRSKLCDEINKLKLIQNQLKKEFDDKKSLNSFRRDLPILENREQLEPKEILFWRIFRDKYLFFKIFSNFLFKDTAKYDQLVRVSCIYRDYGNAVEIIKDKVKSNSYLSFNFDVSNDYGNGILHIFKSIYKDNEENKQFYLKLFTNYRNQFTIYEYSINSIIKSNNLFVFDLFIKHFNLSHQFIKNILSNIFNELKTEEEELESESESELELNYFGNDGDEDDPQDTNQIANNNNNNNSKKVSLEINSNKSLKMFLYLQDNYQLPRKGYFKFSEFNVFNMNVPIGDKSVMKTKHFFKTLTMIKGNSYFNQFCIKSGFNETKEEFEQLKSQFTNDQLELTLYRSIINLTKKLYSQNIEQEIHYQKQYKCINRLLEIYFQLFKYKRFGENSVSINCLFNNVELNCSFLDKTIYSNLYKTNKELFYLKLDVIEEIQKENNENKRNTLIKSALKEIFKFKDPEILDEFLKISKYMEDLFNTDIEFKFQLLNSIESTNILDYFFNDLKYREIIFQDKNNHWQFISYLNILEHYEKLMKQLNRQFSLNNDFYYSHLDLIYEEDLEILDYILRAIKKSNLSSTKTTLSPELQQSPQQSNEEYYYYEIDKELSFIKFQPFFIFCISFTKQDTILSILKFGVFKKVNFNLMYYNTPFFQQIFYKISYWILNNLNEKSKIPKLNLTHIREDFELIIDLENGSNIIFEMSSKFLIRLLSSCGKFKECYDLIENQEDHQENFYQIISYQRFKPNYMVVELFFDYYFNFLCVHYPENSTIKTNFKDHLFFILKGIFANGDIVEFKYLILNYSFIFNTNETPNSKYNSFLTKTQHLDLLTILVNSNYVEMMELFLIFIDEKDYKEFGYKSTDKDKLPCLNLIYKDK